MTLQRCFYERPFAHRALHDVTDGRPENSRAAIDAAIAAGYGIEIDVQLSADGQAMVFHDFALTRLTGTDGDVRAHTAKELSKIVLVGGAEGIPDLSEVLNLIAGRVPLLVEIKDQDGDMGTSIGPLEQATGQVLQSYNGPVAVMSFNPNSVAEMARICPNIPRGIVTSAYRTADWRITPATCDHLREIPDYDRVGACFISHEVDDLARPRVAELKAQGAMIACWTVTSAEQEREARKIADNITFEQYRAAFSA